MILYSVGGDPEDTATIKKLAVLFKSVHPFIEGLNETIINLKLSH